METDIKTYAEYAKERIEELKNKETQAFQALMKLVAPNNQDDAIALYVQATQAQWWEGYYQGRLVSQS